MEDFLFLDFETSPIVATTWGGKYPTIVDVMQDSKIMSVAWSWGSNKKVYCMALPDFPGYKPGILHLNDKKITEFVAGLVSKATAVIAHNGKNFDFKVLRTEMIINGLPPVQFIELDTLTMARQFRFTNNKQDNLSRQLGTSRKLDSGGKDTWKRCAEGDMKAWERLKKYNKGDVQGLKENYFKLRPWAKAHPNMNVLMDTVMGCTKCGSPNIQLRGWRLTTTGKRRSAQCKDCGAWSQGPSISAGVVLR